MSALIPGQMALIIGGSSRRAGMSCQLVCKFGPVWMVMVRGAAVFVAEKHLMPLGRRIPKAPRPVLEAVPA